MVTRTSGAASISFRAKSNSIADSIGTSSSSSGNARYVPAASAAASNNVPRSVADAAANCVFESLQQAGEVRPAERQRCQRGGVDPGEHELVQRPGERARKAGRAGHRAEVVESFVAGRLERRPRRHRFAADVRDRRDAARRQDGCRQARRELRHAESMQADGAAAGHGNRSREIVGGPARGRDDEDARARPRGPRPMPGPLTGAARRPRLR